MTDISSQEKQGCQDSGVANAGQAVSPIVGISIVGTFLILLFAGLYYARSLILPIVLAMLLALTLAPLVRRLTNYGVPAVVSSVLFVLVVGTAVVGLSFALSTPISNMMAEAPNLTRDVRERIAVLGRPLAGISQATKEVEAIASGGGDPDGQQTVVIEQPRLISWVGGTLADIGTILAATLLLAPFLLAARVPIRQKLVRILPSLRSKKVSLHVLNDIENEISRYLLTVAAINAGLGCAVGVAMALLGMPNPLLWGVGAGLLNFVPYAGPFIGIVLASAVSLVTFDSLAVAAVPPVVYLVLQTLEGSAVMPLILGRRLELNAVAILIMLALTTWMWGIVGAVIGVPLLVVVKVFCDRLPSLAAVGVLLSVDTPPGENGGPERRVTEAGIEP